MGILSSDRGDVNRLARSYELTPDEVLLLIDQINMDWERRGITAKSPWDRAQYEKLQDQVRETFTSFSADIRLRIGARLGFFERVRGPSGEMRWQGTQKLRETLPEEVDRQIALARIQEIEARERTWRRV
jgi:hypothetical protein